LRVGSPDDMADDLAAHRRSIHPMGQPPTPHARRGAASAVLERPCSDPHTIPSRPQRGGRPGTRPVVPHQPPRQRNT
jgi:hypothetical protein